MALTAFLKQNKKNTDTIKYIASDAFVDEEGNALEWQLRPLKSKEAERIRHVCNNIKKNGSVDVDTARFNRMVAVTCTVYPNLNDAELQDSYGVMGAEELITEMLDNDGDYQRYIKKCLEISGYNKTDAELVEEAKN